jgi:hypothetical protein
MLLGAAVGVVMYTRRRRRRISPFQSAGFSRQRSPTRSYAAGLSASPFQGIPGSHVGSPGGAVGPTRVDSTFDFDQQPRYAPHDWHVPTVNLDWHSGPGQPRPGAVRTAWAFPTQPGGAGV